MITVTAIVMIIVMIVMLIVMIVLIIVLVIRSTKNMSELLRVSCDTRWQKADQPVDPRCKEEDRTCTCEKPLRPQI